MQDRQIDASAEKMKRSKDPRGRKNDGDPRPHRSGKDFGRNQRIGTRPFHTVRNETEERLQERRHRFGHARRELRVVNNMKAFVLAGLAMLIPAGAPAPAAADTTGSLVGRVRDASGRPVAGTIVRVSSPSEVTQTTSDANGRYCFVGLVPETYAVTVDKTGYAEGMYVGVRVAAGNQTVSDAVLNLRIIRWVKHIDIVGTVNPGQGADVYSIGRWNSLIDTSRTIGEVLPFVPGVQVIGGSPYPR